MTAAREALVLPLLLLTVTLFGSLRFGTPLVMAPPSIFALVLSALLVGALVQSGAFDPSRVVNSARPALANGNGIVVLAALFMAGAQVFSLLTPESGLPRLVLGVYFLILMLNTIAAGPDRVRLLRSLGVTFGAAFLLKFVVLDALSDPSSGRLGRALQLLLEGVTLGAVTQEAQHAASGYVAFATLALFLVAVWLLPERGGLAVRPPRRRIDAIPEDERPLLR
jgi:hypothetical protein